MCLFGTEYPTKANQPKFHILFYKKSQPQDFITRTFAKKEREKWWFTYVHSFRISPWKPIKLLLAGMAEHNGLKDPHKSDLHITFYNYQPKDIQLYNWESFQSFAKSLLKIRIVNKAGLFWHCTKFTQVHSWLIQYIFRNKFFFVFHDRKLKFAAPAWKRILCNLTNFQLNQTKDRKNKNCLNDNVWILWNSFSNRCWKFQLFILEFYSWTK